MIDGSGRTSPRAFAFYDRATSCWRTSQGSLFPGATDDGGGAHLSKASLVSWPRSGSMRDGIAYEPATSEPRTVETVYSSLLSTPTASDTTGPGGTDNKRGGGRNLRTDVSLLPTPCERDWREGADFTPHAEKIKLPHAIKLLPTPSTDDPRGTIEQYRQRLADHDGRNSTFVPLSMIGAVLLPTPTENDSRGGRNKTSGRTNPNSRHHDGTTLVDWARLHGATTPEPSPDGNTSSADPPPSPPTSADD